MHEGRLCIMYWPLRGWSLALVAAMFLAGCAVELVSDYDEITDQAVTALQRDFETFFVTVEGQPDPPECEYAHHSGFYRQVGIDLSAIEVRARAIAKNEITVEQLELMRDSVGSMQRLHKLACLAPAQVQNLRSSFNSHFTAILRLELAKKRAN